LLVYLCIQGIPEQPGTGKIARLIAVFPSYFVFKNENVKVKVKYGFVLYLGIYSSSIVFGHVMSCLVIESNFI
jgi:hypothetical protein